MILVLVNTKIRISDFLQAYVVTLYIAEMVACGVLSEKFEGLRSRGPSHYPFHSWNIYRLSCGTVGNGIYYIALN